MLSWLHKFRTPKADGVDSTLVKPSDWNDQHEVKSDMDGFVLGRVAGEGPGDVHEIVNFDIMNTILPAGMTAPFAGTVVPAGWYLCYGQLLNRITDARLFTALGTQYGAGDGSTTFALPDYRGVALVGASNMGGTDRGNLPGGGTVGNYLGAPSVFVNFNSSNTVNINFGNLGFVFQGGNAHIAAESGGGMQFGGGGVFCQAGDYVAVDSIAGYVNANGNFGIGVYGQGETVGIVQPSVVSNMIIKR